MGGVWEWSSWGETPILRAPTGHDVPSYSWNTQTANQAIGTGVLVGCRYGRRAWPGQSWTDSFSPYAWWSFWHVPFRAEQSARIGFCDL